MYYTYIIQSRKDKRFYTGFTRDLKNRFNEHNSGKIASTKNRGPFELIYYEACLNEQDAIAREKYLKSVSISNGVNDSSRAKVPADWIYPREKREGLYVDDGQK